jgi:ribose 5-phosphate isomerase B
MSDPVEVTGQSTRVGIAADHGGFALKLSLIASLKSSGYVVVDYGDVRLNDDDDYPDFVIPLARAVVSGEVFRGLAICGSGVGACVASNKVVGARAALIVDSYSAHQGVEDDDMNIMCLGGRVTGPALAWDLVQAFLAASYLETGRFNRRLAKISDLERNESGAVWLLRLTNNRSAPERENHFYHAKRFPTSDSGLAMPPPYPSDIEPDLSVVSVWV